MTVKFVVTPGGEKLAILPASEFEDMQDMLIHQRAMADYRAGRTEGYSLDDVHALLDAPTPLAFWRAKRGLTPAALARAAKISERDLAELESGEQQGSLDVMARIAKVLKVSLESLASA